MTKVKSADDKQEVLMSYRKREEKVEEGESNIQVEL